MVNGFDVASEINKYIAKQINLDQLREWVLCAHIAVADEKDKANLDNEAVRMLAEIAGRYAEFSDGLVSEDVLRKRIGAILAPKPQSAESCFLTSFYSSPLQPVEASITVADSSNFNRSANYVPEELVA